MEPIGPTTALRVDDLWQRRGRRAVLNGLSLRLPVGSRMVVVGGNGSGKTTLLRTIVGLSRPDRGRIQVCGQPAGSDAAGRSLGWLPERPVLPPAPTVRALLRTACTLTQTPADAIPSTLDRMGLDAIADRPPSALSQGQTRQVALALALVHSPALLLLDEPFTALDPHARERVSHVLQDPRWTVLATAHHPDEAPSPREETRFLRGGQLYEEPE